jgi:hypothetical protein
MAETGILKVWPYMKPAYISQTPVALTITNFKAEWAELSGESKEQLRDGIVNGSLTY